MRRRVAAALLTGAVLLAGCGGDPTADRRSVSDLYIDPNPESVQYRATVGDVFDQAEADQLASELAAAVDGSDWCLGWNVVIGTNLEVGSNLGEGVPATSCAQWVVVAVEINWVSSSSESNDSAGLAIFSSDPSVQARLRANGELTRGAGPSALAGNSGDAAVANTISSIALEMAQAGELTPLAVNATEAPDGVEFEDREGEGGIDGMNQMPGRFVLGIVLLVLALVYLVFKLIARAARSSISAAGSNGSTAGGPAPSGGNPRKALRAALEHATGPTPVPPGPDGGGTAAAGPPVAGPPAGGGAPTSGNPRRALREALAAATTDHPTPPTPGGSA